MFNIFRSWRERKSSKGAEDPSPSQDASARPEDPTNSAVAALNAESEERLLPISAGSKRNRAIFEPESQVTSEDVGRPAKVIKTDDSDYLRDRLPELIDAREQEEMRNRLSLTSQRDQILLQSQHENVIAALPLTKATITLLVELLELSINRERERLKSLRTTWRDGHKLALVITE
ncbi:hypothetical protein CPC08DRAFT_285110 [Agrocybe pediades]|nr:hypothetical protein CPC08DRAFT_285110 [Agrocybe pediades]